MMIVISEMIRKMTCSYIISHLIISPEAMVVCCITIISPIFDIQYYVFDE